MANLSVIILTKNEELFIERCIRSVLWAEEVLVLDCGSTDRTKEIAISLGAHVYEQQWLGYSAQRDKAISLARNDWVFLLDSDEIVTPELANSIQEAMASSSLDERNGYSVNRRGDFYGILMPNTSPPHRRLNFVRLFNRQYSAYDLAMKVHEDVRFSGKAILLKGELIHWRALMMDDYITSANRYATLEAEALNQKGCKVSGSSLILRPILRFLWCYFVHKEFLLGTRGLIHAMLLATREYIRYTKLWEMQNATQVLNPPPHVYSDLPLEQEHSDVIRTLVPEKDVII